MIKRKQLPGVLALVTASCLGLLFIFTNPNEGGPVLVVIFLALLFILLFLITFTALAMPTFSKAALSRPARYYSSIVAASGISFLVGLQTIRQLQILDIVLTMVFIGGSLFYIYRRL